MKVEDALYLLGVSEKKILSMKEAVEIIELITRNPETIKDVLITAEERGIIKKEGKTVYISTESSNFPKPRIKRVDCESACRRCNVKIKNCYYVVTDDKELGPYGSECINRIL
jgi:hypothetical protein